MVNQQDYVMVHMAKLVIADKSVDANLVFCMELFIIGNIERIIC